MPLPEVTYDVVFSFSVLGYIAPNDVLSLQNRLASLVRDGGVIIHCSIPDRGIRAVTIVEGSFRRHGWYGWLLTPMLFAHRHLRRKDRYGGNGYWHDPQNLVNRLHTVGATQVLSADVYYRFDLLTKISR